MVSYIIRLRTIIDKNKIRIYINQFIKSGDFKARFLKISIQVHNEDSITTIIDNVYLDTKNKKELRTLKFNAVENILVKFTSNDLRASIKKFVISYKEINKSEYLESFQ